MTLTAGYDLVTEICKSTLLDLIKANLQINGVNLSPPFEIPIPITGTATGEAWLIVNDMDMDLNADNSMTLRLNFERTAINVQTPFQLLVSPLDGSIEVTCPLALVSGNGNQMSPSALMQNADVSIDFSATANQAIENDLAGTGITVQMFHQIIEQTATDFFRSIGQQDFPLSFTVIPGQNGSLSPLQFERLDLKCLTNGRQALALMGSFLTLHHTWGNPADKTETALTPNREICTSISPTAFHNFIFTPAISEALGVPPEQLPPTCGTSPGTDFSGVTIRSISDSFANGAIHLNGYVTKSGFCYDASGSFHGTITLSVGSSGLTPALNMDDPNIDVDIPWYCYLAAGVVLGPIGLIITGIVDSAAEGIVQKMADSAMNDALGNSLDSVSIEGLGGASFHEVFISPEGINLQGDAPFINIPSGTEQRFYLSGDEAEISRQVVDTGEIYIEWPFIPVAKTYPYTEYAISQRGTYVISHQLYTPPFDLKWDLRVSRGGNTYSDIYPLDTDNGVITLANIKCDYPVPLPGGSSVDKDVNVTFTKTANGLRITNDPSDGSFHFNIALKATDATGLVVDKQTTAAFDGSLVEYGGTWEEDMQANAAEGASIFGRLGKRLVDRFEMLDPIGPVSQIEDISIIYQIQDMISRGTHQAEVQTVLMKAAMGKSFNRAMRSEAAKRPGKAQTASAPINQMQRMAGLTMGKSEIAQSIAGITGALLAAKAKSKSRM